MSAACEKKETLRGLGNLLECQMSFCLGIVPNVTALSSNVTIFLVSTAIKSR